MLRYLILDIMIFERSLTIILRLILLKCFTTEHVYSTPKTFDPILDSHWTDQMEAYDNYAQQSQYIFIHNSKSNWPQILVTYYANSM